MSDDDLPTTVEAAVRVLQRLIPEEEQAAIAALPEASLSTLHLGLGLWIRNAFGLWKEGSRLLAATGEKEPDDAALAIIQALWRSLRRERVRLH
jgi:hypothetical protein